MWPIATVRVAWSVCLSVGHVHESCKNGWTDRNVDWWVDLGGPMVSCIRPWSLGQGPFTGRVHFWVDRPIESVMYAVKRSFHCR